MGWIQPNKYHVDENAYGQNIGVAGQNNLDLQAMLMEQARGGGPNLAAQQFQNSQQALAGQAAGQVGAIKGISPAAQARLLGQQTAGIGANLAGEAATQRMQQQLAAQQMLGQNSLGMYGTSVQGQLGAQGINAGVATSNADFWGKGIGGLANGLGAGVTKMGGMADGGVVGEDGPQSEIGRALMGMSAGGPVFMSDGGVPGQAPVAGDSPANDRVPALLSPGEIVIPRSAAESPDAAASFVAALQRRNGGGYQDVLSKRAMCRGGAVGYAEGGEVEEPQAGRWESLKRWAASVPDNLREKALEAAADALPDSLGGKVRAQSDARKKAADEAARAE